MRSESCEWDRTVGDDLSLKDLDTLPLFLLSDGVSHRYLAVFDTHFCCSMLGNSQESVDAIVLWGVSRIRILHVNQLTFMLPASRSTEYGMDTVIKFSVGLMS